jgi:uncharacterized protein (DUF1800 family)
MDRRSFFTFSAREEEYVSPVQPARITTGLKRYKGKWNDPVVAHLLRRTTFGAPKEQITQFSKQSLKKTVKHLLHTEEALPAPPVNNYNDDKYTDEEIQPGQTWVNSLTINGMNNFRRINSFKAWWIGQMLGQQATLREKMVLFWHNHFATETNMIGNAIYTYRHNTLLRQYALGNFKELVKAITIDAAMLRYLNGYVNTKKAPDENYGRELQELFTMGKGPDSKYTEDDVKAAARVLTGYTINGKTFEVSFDPKRHDETNKQFSAFYGNKVIEGKKGADGAKELDELLDMLFEQEEVSRFICRKFYRFFVYHTIDDSTEQQVIAPLAALFRKEKYEVKPVLQTLLSSEHFFDAGNRGSMIKSPVDLTIGLCREFKVSFADVATDYMGSYNQWEIIRNQANILQQNIGDPPNVAGWQAYYQEPQYDKLWISSDTLPKRNQLTDRMVNDGLTRNNQKILIDPVAFAAKLPHPDYPDDLIRDSMHLLLAVPLPEESIPAIKTSILLSGLTGMQSDHYWTNAWMAYQSNPNDKANQKIVVGKLKALYKFLMNQPEYQLC